MSASWASRLLEDIWRLHVWRRPEATVCLVNNLQPSDVAALSPYCALEQTRFRFDPMWAFVPKTYKMRTWSPMPGHSPGTLLQNPIVNYSFAPAWDRIDLLLEPFYRRWDHIVYIDADHLVLKRFELTTLTSGARRPTPPLAPRCARAPRLLS